MSAVSMTSLFTVNHRVWFKFAVTLQIIFIPVTYAQSTPDSPDDFGSGSSVIVFLVCGFIIIMLLYVIVRVLKRCNILCDEPQDSDIPYQPVNSPPTVFTGRRVNTNFTHQSINSASTCYGTNPRTVPSAPPPPPQYYHSPAPPSYDSLFPSTGVSTCDNK